MIYTQVEIMASPSPARSSPSKLAAKKRPPSLAVTRATEKQRMFKQLVCSDAPEQAMRYRGFRSIAGIDEVGRGALFGPVVAAAVILPERMTGLARAGLRDSKQLTRQERERLDRRIRTRALAVCVAEVSAEIIDTINIYQATRQAMLRAVEGLILAPDHLLIDAMRVDHTCSQTRLFYGDALSLSIAAASVVAKVHRDALMRELDAIHPQYGLASHKGYATPEHRRALKLHGPLPLHRRSFRPVAACLPQDELAELELTDMLIDPEDLENSPDLDLDLALAAEQEPTWA